MVVDSAAFSVVDELLMLVHESAEYYKDEDGVYAVLTEARRIIANIRRRLHCSDRRYVVAMVGLTNVGKSTLLNALLGDELAPRRNGPCTAAPIEFVFGDERRVTVHYHMRLRRPSWLCANTAAIHLRLQELADDRGAETSRAIRKVIVEVPHPLLAGGVVIADTPGFGAAQDHDAAGSHEDSLKNYLHQDVSQVIWIVLAEQGIGRREQQFYQQFLGDVCDDILVTGSEDWEVKDKDRFRRRFAAELGQRLPRFHFVSGLRGLQARRTGDLAGLEAAGITSLENRLRELADLSERQSVQIANLIQMAQELSLWLREYRDERGLPLERCWRPDSWYRWRCLTGDAQIHELAAQLTQLLEIKV